jgi:carboxylesterase type B
MTREISGPGYHFGRVVTAPAARPQPSTGVHDTIELGMRAPQPAGGAAIVQEWVAPDRREPMGEDCLCLNVWTLAANR